jgi:glyoxylase-like metal-dependent hydrolase (beta-lactamase superfamily II)
MNERRIHEILPVGMLACNCSILGDAETGEAIVIDPGDDVARIQEILARHKLRVKAIVSTHTHIDHVGGLARLHELTGAPVFFHQADLEMYRHLDIQARWLGVQTPPVTKVENFLKEGDALDCGVWQLQVLHTPGHTEGSISLYVPAENAVGLAAQTLTSPSRNVPAPMHGNTASGGTASANTASGNRGAAPPILFAGDTLFAGSIGRTDLWGGSLEEIMRSLQGKLLALPDDTVVFPGHGPETTIGQERETNPFLRSR